MEGIEGALVRRIIGVAGLILAALALLVLASEFYYESGSGKRCVVCHEMQPLYTNGRPPAIAVWRAQSATEAL